MNYVMHDCKSKNCNNGWIDKDITHATMYPPSWKYCKECCEKLGIDFDSQTPNSNLSDEELKIKQKRIENLKFKKSKLRNKIKS